MQYNHISPSIVDALVKANKDKPIAMKEKLL